MKNGRDHFPFRIIIFLIISSLTLALFNHWEPSGESWGYWTFARIFSQTGTFIIPDRSAAYILYLNLFTWLGYPGEIIAEYFVSTLIVAISLVVLFRRYLPWQWLTLAVILWIPFLQMAEPPVQKLALACSCFAVTLREANPSRFRISLSYALLILAYMFRSTYMICFGIFLIWDLFGILKKKISVRNLLPTRYDWPIFIALFLLIWVHVAQSPHRWNNPWLATDQWFSSQDKSLANQGFLGSYNSEYIKQGPGSSTVKDIYFTNQELFGGATTMFEAIRANPKFVLKQILIHVKYVFIIGAKFTLIPYSFYEYIPQGSCWWYPIHLLITLPILGIIFYGAFRGCTTNYMRCFLAANILMLGTLILVIPKERYMYPIIPILLLSSSWYTMRAQNVFRNPKLPFLQLKKFGGRVCYGLIFLVVLLFSRGTMDWLKIIGDVSKDMSKGTVSVLQERLISTASVKLQIEPIVDSCRGVLSLEHNFWAAFSGKSWDQFYDIWEIPPFGSLENSPYDGLRPDRIDCVIVSDNLKMSVDDMTNARIRYQYYIKPYVEQLKRLGAKTYEIPFYGSVTVLGR